MRGDVGLGGALFFFVGLSANDFLGYFINSSRNDLVVGDTKVSGHNN